MPNTNLRLHLSTQFNMIVIALFIKTTLNNVNNVIKLALTATVAELNISLR